MNAPSSVRRGGYEPYGSVRRGSATRWRVFARYQLEVAWQTWWRYRLALLIAVMVTATFAGLMYFLSDSSMFRGFRRLGGGELAIADGVLPASIQWYRRAAFVLSLTVTAGPPGPATGCGCRGRGSTSSTCSTRGSGRKRPGVGS